MGVEEKVEETEEEKGEKWKAKRGSRGQNKEEKETKKEVKEGDKERKMFCVCIPFASDHLFFNLLIFSEAKPPVNWLICQQKNKKRTTSKMPVAITLNWLICQREN